MRPEDMGVSPVYRATGDGNYTIPAGFRCIGFHCGVAGDVAFTSGGVAVTVACEGGSQYAAQVDSFQASGTTATGIFALLVKG